MLAGTMEYQEPAPAKKLYKFFSKFELAHFKKGETFLRSGDLPQGIYYLKTGYVRLYSLSPQGKELTLVIYKPGEFFPVVFTFTARASIYYFETLSEATMYKAPREKFMQFINENQDIFTQVTLHIIERFETSLKRMESLTFGNVNSRLASVILIYTKRFGVKYGRGNIRIPIPFTHQDLANLVGTARESVSHEIKIFVDKRIIGYMGKLIVVKDLKKLKKEAGLV